MASRLNDLFKAFGRYVRMLVDSIPSLAFQLLLHVLYLVRMDGDLKACRAVEELKKRK